MPRSANHKCRGREVRLAQAVLVPLPLISSFRSGRMHPSRTLLDRGGSAKPPDSRHRSDNGRRAVQHSSAETSQDASARVLPDHTDTYSDTSSARRRTTPPRTVAAIAIPQSALLTTCDGMANPLLAAFYYDGEYRAVESAFPLDTIGTTHGEVVEI